MTQYRTYPPAPLGLGTQFPEQERPPTHASRMRNRFINPGGGAEKRQGIVTAATLVSGPDFKFAQEFIESRGTAHVVLAGGSGVFVVDATAGTSITTAHTGLDASAGKPRMAQSDDKLIIVNGQDRNIFTTDLTKFRELRPIVEAFETVVTATAHDRTYVASSATQGTFTDWLTETNVAVNDLLFDSQTSAFALITKVSSDHIDHTALTAGSPGLASGNAAKAGGDFCEIHDLVELNIIPVSSQGGGVEFDNVAVGETGTSAEKVKVSGILWSTTDVLPGDYISNTTRNQVCRVESLNVSSLNVTKVCGQTSGDSLVFLKSAMPVASDVHVHYGRTYYLDARDHRKIRISGPKDPQDLTTDAGTIDSTTFKFGDQQPTGGEMLAMSSYQQYLAIGGKRNILLYSGIDPIQDTSADTLDFTPQALFPVGVASPDSMMTIGNDLVWLGKQGLDSAALRGSDTLPTQEHLSEGIRDEIQVAVCGTDPDKVKIFNYPKRQWIVSKVSSELFVFNYSPNLAEAFQRATDIAAQTRVGSWSRFDGLAAQQNHYLVKADQKLVAAGNSGQFFDFDVPGTYTDGGGSAYSTEYQTAWLGLDEAKGKGQPSRQQKAGIALQPQIDSSAGVTYTISATAPYSGESSEQVNVDLSAESDSSIPLRWRGERVRLTFETSGSEGPDVLTSYTVVYNKYGVT